MRGVTWARIEVLIRRGHHRAIPRASRDVRRPGQPAAAPGNDRAAARYGPRDSADHARFPGVARARRGRAWRHSGSTGSRGQPLGRAPARFREFRFNDHLIWGAIFSLALLLAPLPATGRAVAANLVVLWGGLYAARGLAVHDRLAGSHPLLFRMLVILLAVVLNPLVLGISIAMGLADTWLDLRGRLLPSEPQGGSDDRSDSAGRRRSARPGGQRGPGQAGLCPQFPSAPGPGLRGHGRQQEADRRGRAGPGRPPRPRIGPRPASWRPDSRRSRSPSTPKRATANGCSAR